MKKLFALLLALLMLISSGAALAEPSTAYYVTVMDPIVYQNGEPILDMTGLEIDLGAMVSDIGSFALQALAYVGENYDIQALGAQAQLDTNGLTFSVNGVENLYSFDLSQFTAGFDVTSLLPRFPAHTLLNTPIEMEVPSIDPSLSARYAIMTEMLAEFTAEDGTIAIDKNQGELIINRALTAVENVTNALDIDGVAELRAMRPAFDLNGTLTVEGDPAADAGSYIITGSGNFYAEDLESSIPFELNYSDSNEALNLSVNIHEGEDSAQILADGVFTTAADGREGMELTTALLVNGEEQVSTVISAMPAESAPQMDYSINMYAPVEETELSVVLSTGTNGDDLGFMLDFFAYDGYDTSGGFLYYNGEKFVDEYGTALNGYVSIGVGQNEETVGLDTYLFLEAAGVDTSAWAYDSTGAIDIETLSDAEMAALEAELMGVVNTAATAISENVPGIATLISSMMG